MTDTIQETTIEDLPNFDDEIMCEAKALDTERSRWYCEGKNPAEYRLVGHCGQIFFYCALCLDIKRKVMTLFCRDCKFKVHQPNVLRIYRRIDPL